MDNAVVNPGDGSNRGTRRVTVSLEFIPKPNVAPNLAAALQTEFNAHLPLTDLQWKSSSRGVLRTIDSLQLDFKPFSECKSRASTDTTAAAALGKGGAATSQNLLERPYAHVLFVACDDNEVYRTNVRPEIRAWMDAATARRGSNAIPHGGGGALPTLSSSASASSASLAPSVTHSSSATASGAGSPSSSSEWIIVHVTAHKQTGPKKFYQTKGSVFDKIRADFNTGKRDRVVQLARPQSTQAPGSQLLQFKSDVKAVSSDEDHALWRDFLVKVKEAVVASFDTNFSSYEEEVRKVDAQRQLPGWNFCTFFIQKEALAHSFEAMNLLEDALVQYDELEASYSLSARDAALPWFSSIGGHMPGDDALTILSSSSKPFRQLIARNEITVFDFRIYLFSRQAALVCNLGRIAELPKRALPFILGMARMLHSHGGALSTGFCETWIYSACMDVSQRCQQHCAAANINSAALPDLLPLLAELAEIAIRQLEKLGMLVDFLPRHHPFLMSADVVKPELTGEEISPKVTCSRPGLSEALADRERFDTLYRGLLNQVCDYWRVSGRHRSVVKVKASLAALEQCRQNAQKAEDAYSRLSPVYGQNGWQAVEAQFLAQAVALQKSEGKYRDALLSSLALLRSRLQAGSQIWSLGHTLPPGREEKANRVVPDTAIRASELIEDIRKLSLHLERDFAAISFPTLAIRYDTLHGNCLPDEDGVSVTLCIHNMLPCSIHVEEIRLKLVALSGEPLWLTRSATLLNAGKNVIRLSSFTVAIGTCAIELSQIRLGKIVFQYSHRPSEAANRHHPTALAESLVSSHQPIVVFRRDYGAVEVDVDQERDLVLREPRRCHLSIRTGSRRMASATLTLRPIRGSVSFIAHKCIAQPPTVALSNEGKDIFHLSNFLDTDSHTLCLPYEVRTRDAEAIVAFTLEYTTQHRPDFKRVCRGSFTLRIALPLSVNVQDFRREHFILSRFTVSSNSTSLLEIKDVNLEAAEAFSTCPYRKRNDASTLVKGHQTATFLFKIEPSIGTVDRDRLRNAESSDARFTVKAIYRTQAATFKQVLRKHVSKIFNAQACPLSPSLLRAIITEVARRSEGWNGLASRGGVLPYVNEDVWRRLLDVYYIGDDRLRSQLLQCLGAIHQTPIDTGLSESSIWSTLSISFDLPSVAIFNRVAMQLPPEIPSPLQYGDMVNVSLIIHTSYKWATFQERRQLLELQDGPRMSYEVIGKAEDWIIAGRVRGEFQARESTMVNIPLTLVPIRGGGRLFLPMVHIRPIPSRSSTAESASDGAQTPVRIEDDGPASSELAYSCETFYENAAMSFAVVDGSTTKATAKIDPAPRWLVSAQ